VTIACEMPWDSPCQLLNEYSTPALEPAIQGGRLAFSSADSQDARAYLKCMRQIVTLPNSLCVAQDGQIFLSFY
jgi:hypothetical protein